MKKETFQIVPHLSIPNQYYLFREDRTEQTSKILETQRISTVILSENKTKFFLQWDGYIKAKLRELRLN